MLAYLQLSSKAGENQSPRLLELCRKRAGGTSWPSEGFALVPTCRIFPAQGGGPASNSVPLGTLMVSSRTVKLTTSLFAIAGMGEVLGAQTPRPEAKAPVGCPRSLPSIARPNCPCRQKQSNGCNRSSSDSGKVVVNDGLECSLGLRPLSAESVLIAPRTWRGCRRRCKPPSGTTTD